MYCLRAADGCGASFRQPDVADLTLFDEVCHAPDRLLDGDVGVHVVLPGSTVNQWDRAT